MTAGALTCSKFKTIRTQIVIYCPVSGQMEENVYVSMKSSHGNEGKDDGKKKQEKEEESVYGKQIHTHTKANTCYQRLTHASRC